MTTLRPASSFRGYTVRNRAGEDVGAIEDFVFDTERAEVRYAVVSFGGFLGLGEHHFAVPFPRLVLDTENECFIADVDETELAQARSLGERTDEPLRTVYRFQGVDARRRGMP